jgi:hypothetical protein
MQDLRRDHGALIRQNLNGLFARYEGRFGEAEARACLATRPDVAQITMGKPTFKPNYFLTCAANTAIVVGHLFKPEDRHVLIYEVRGTAKNLPPHLAAMRPVGAPPSTVMAKLQCAYRVQGDRIEAYKEDDGLFATRAVPVRISRADPCMELPEAYAQTSSIR